jgi:hypothetical protein
MKRVLTLFLAVMLLITAVPFAQAAPSFSDVPRNHWAYKEITAMAEKGIIKGYADGKFRPNNHITRAEFAKIMIAASGIDMNKSNIKQTFQDVPKSHWAFYYVEYAKPYLTGYKSGSRYTYKPDQYAVREDIAVALVRLLGYDRNHRPDLSVISRFKDDERMSPALRPYIAISIQTGLMKGFEGYFRPQDEITRAEAASLLYRALLDKNEDEDKVVFPLPDTEPQPDLPTSVTDSFSDTTLKYWQTDKANATWGVVNKQVTAISTDNDVDHYFLPLKWKEEVKPKKYELTVDVLANGSDGLGGVFFNGADGKANVVYISKDRVTLAKVNDANSKELDVIASGSYKLRSSNKLRVVVNEDNCSIYLNGQFLFGQQQFKHEGTKLGLYLQEEAADEVPREITYFDNFNFKVLN